MFGRKLLHCSFCGKDETQISKLVAGPGVYICDACVATARDIMDSSNGGDNVPPRVTSSQSRGLLSWIGRLVSGDKAHRCIDASAS